MSSFQYRAGDGEDAQGKGNNGAAGNNRVVFVPLGTTVKEITREYDYESAQLPEELPMPKAAKEEILRLSGRANYIDTITTLAELSRHQQAVLVATGGNPGYGNRSLRTGELEPATPHIVGQDGERRVLKLEMTLIADVGLVGFPNAGKSSFLRQISRATPKVAPYPFTTLHPILGVVKFPDTFTITVADIPGIIEGASQNRGLGLEFLRHIERTRVLVYVIDVCSEHGAVSDLKALQKELKAYDASLPLRPSVIVANKMDLPGAEAGLQALRKATLLPVIAVSAQAGSNVELVVRSLRWLMETQDKLAKQAEAKAEAKAEVSTDSQKQKRAYHSDDIGRGQPTDDSDTTEQESAYADVDDDNVVSDEASDIERFDPDSVTIEVEDVTDYSTSTPSRPGETTSSRRRRRGDGSKR